MEFFSKINILWCLLFLSAILWGQDKPGYAVNLIADSLMKDVNHVVRLDEETFEVLSDSKSLVIYKRVVTVFNAKSNRSHAWVDFIKDDGIEYFKVRVYDAAGKLIKKVKKREIVEHVANISGGEFDDRMMKSYQWVSNNYPFTIEYAYQKKVTGIANAVYETWFFEGFNEGVEHSSFTLKLPKDKKFYAQLLNADIKPEERIDGDHKIITWTMENLAPIYNEDMMPAPSRVLPILDVKPDKFEMAGVKGSMATWEDYSAFMKKLFSGKDELPAALQKEMDQLLKDAKSDREKIDRIYQYVQANTRYVSVQLGDGGWIPYDAAYVYEHKYGDCKALTNYTCSLLKYAGISATPTLVFAGAGGPVFDLDSSFVSTKFNHVILYVPKEDCWLECTSPQSPSNYLGSFTKNRPVMLIQEEGGGLIKTPNYTAEDNVITNLLEIAIDEKGKAVIDGHRIYEGEEQEYVRYYHFANDEKKIREWFKKSLGKVTNILLKSFEHQCSQTQPLATLDFKIEADRFASIAGKRFFVPVNSVDKFTCCPKFDDKRKYEIVSHDAYTAVDTFIYKIHPKYVIEKNPLREPVQFSSKFGSYDAHIIFGQGKITYIRKLIIRPYTLPVSQKKELKDFFKKVRKWDAKKIVFKEGGV